MRHILRAYTMWVDGVDYGYEIEELQCALPNEVYVDHMYGGAVMTAQVPMVKIEALEPTIKFASHNPDISGLLMRPPGTVDTFTFRSALIDETDGTTRANVIIYEGRLAAPEPDPWAREDKAGLGYGIKSVRYYSYEVGGARIHEVGLNPRKLMINRVDLLAGINEALGG
ncbi:MAG: phage major tail tube protein [Devosia sp.]